MDRFIRFFQLARRPRTGTIVHSFTMSLRHQLKETDVKVNRAGLALRRHRVAEREGGQSLRPPTDAPGSVHRRDHKALEGDADEVAIGDAKKLVAAAGGKSAQKAFSGMNQGFFRHEPLMLGGATWL